jgi:hypothetical protein
MGYETGIDLDSLIEAAKRLQEIIGRELPGQVMKAENGTAATRSPHRGRTPRRAGLLGWQILSAFPGPLPEGRSEGPLPPLPFLRS